MLSGVIPSARVSNATSTKIRVNDDYSTFIIPFSFDLQRFKGGEIDEKITSIKNSPLNRHLGGGD